MVGSLPLNLPTIISWAHELANASPILKLSICVMREGRGIMAGLGTWRKLDCGERGWQDGKGHSMK